jgi:hypothetical protein
MTDQLEHLFEDLRRQTLPTIVAPGPDAARATVRRKREIRAAAGSVVAVAVIAVAVGVTHRPPIDAAGPSSPSAGPPISVPEPDASLLARAEAAGNALGDPDRNPWVMATQTVVEGADYENDINDIGEGRYYVFLYCVGPGRLSVQIKADQYGTKVLASGIVPCHEQPAATRLRVTQPHTGYLRLFAHAEDGAAGAAGLAFKFVRAE